MCHYITASLPHYVDTDSIAPIFESHKLGFDLISNPHVSAQLEAGDLYLLTTRAHCDCGTALGSLNVSTARDDLSYERELKKFRKQGWSEAKINRWLEQINHYRGMHCHRVVVVFYRPSAFCALQSPGMTSFEP